jgi:hypothetical protein
MEVRSIRRRLITNRVSAAPQSSEAICCQTWSPESPVRDPRGWHNLRAVRRTDNGRAGRADRVRHALGDTILLCQAHVRLEHRAIQCCNKTTKVDDAGRLRLEHEPGTLVGKASAVLALAKLSRAPLASHHNDLPSIPAPLVLVQPQALEFDCCRDLVKVWYARWPFDDAKRLPTLPRETIRQGGRCQWRCRQGVTTQARRHEAAGVPRQKAVGCVSCAGLLPVRSQ